MTNYADLIAKLKLAMETGQQFERQAEMYRARIDVLKAENAKLTRRLQEKSRDARLLRTAETGAQYMIALHLSGCTISRASMVADGMPERSWYWGRSLLMAARVHDGRGITSMNTEELAAALSGAVSRIERQGFYALNARNTKHGHDKRWRNSLTDR